MIRWEEDFGENDDERWWVGYLGKVMTASAEKIREEYEMTFFFTGGCTYYTKLSSAKRGAERMLERFLEDAGLKRDAEWR